MVMIHREEAEDVGEFNGMSRPFHRIRRFRLTVVLCVLALYRPVRFRRIKPEPYQRPEFVALGDPGPHETLPCWRIDAGENLW